MARAALFVAIAAALLPAPHASAASKAPTQAKRGMVVTSQVDAARADLIERLADSDEQILEIFAEDREPTQDEMVDAIRRATCAATFVPVLCGSAFKNKGVQRLLDAVIDYLPSPADLPAIHGVHPKTGEELERPAEDDDPAPLAQAFGLPETADQALPAADLGAASGSLLHDDFTARARARWDELGM